MTRLKTCPICEHTQSKDDPTGHVCAQVLRARLREAQGQLDAIRVIVENDDPVAGARYLRMEHDAAPAAMEASIIAGHRQGVKHTIAALKMRVLSAPWYISVLLAGQYRLLCSLKVPGYQRTTTDDR